MPFLAAIPAIIAAAAPAAAAGVASAAGGAIVNGIANAGKNTPSGTPQSAPIVNPLDNAQFQHSGQAAQAGINQQQNFVDALGAQNGIGNQSSVYNQEQGLANQLGDMAQGGGPNPALTQLNQTTGQNIASQSALMAGQRGAGANAGLIARQAAQNGGAINQQAAGQAATMRANQQLAAIGALQQQQGMLGGLSTQQVGQQAQGLNNVIANNNQQQQMQLNAVQAQNSANLQNQANINGINSDMAKQQQAQQYQTGQGIASGIGSAVTAGVGSAMKPSAPAVAPAAPQIGPVKQNGSFALGGMVGYAQGGEIAPQQGYSAIMKENYGKPRSKVGAHLSGISVAGYAHGGTVKAMVSPGEIYLTPKQADKVAQGKMSPMAGERIPGKAKVAGDSEKNDTVPKDLQKGGVVVKRTKARDPKEAADFVAAVKGGSLKRGKR